MEGSGAGSVLVTNGFGCGSVRPKNLRIRIRSTGTYCRALHRYETALGSYNLSEEFAYCKLNSCLDRSYRSAHADGDPAGVCP
jgi:hypothetical protein